MIIIIFRENILSKFKEDNRTKRTHTNFQIPLNFEKGMRGQTIKHSIHIYNLIGLNLSN